MKITFNRQWRVGKKKFKTREEAEAFVRGETIPTLVERVAVPQEDTRWKSADETFQSTEFSPNQDSFDSQ